MTPNDLISSALRLIGALASGETAESADMADAFIVLNQMLDSYNAESLMMYTRNINTFPLVVGQQVYTLGTGGNFNIPRPAKLERISIVNLGNVNQPLELPMTLYTDRDWQMIPVKNIGSTLPQGVYDDGAFPLRNLSYWPIPSTNVNTILYSWSPLNAFPDLTTDVTLPPGYMEALRYNLAVRLIAEMPGEFNPVMVQVTSQLATESLARVRAMNIGPIEAFCDDALIMSGGRYNIFSDLPVGGRSGS